MGLVVLLVVSSANQGYLESGLFRMASADEIRVDEGARKVSSFDQNMEVIA